ncbi:MAG TPA: Uma2 family endonuclease [Polyangiaceae bacterium]|nr:Uma2 family endonuclease [Polyangiaceae bacterium]
MFAEELRNHDDTPVDDKIVVLNGLRWSDYQRMLEARGDQPLPRLAYLEGQLEIMTPAKPHEWLASRIGHLIAVWCLEMGIEFCAYGPWTLEKKEAERGVEPDECYVFGVEPGATRPHLAIEVVWTTGGLRKLDIYQKLGVQEVWFWRRGKLTAHVLSGEQYLEAATSSVLPGIDLSRMGQYLDRATTSQAIREYRSALNPGKP